MDKALPALLPALRWLHDQGDVADALRLVEAVHDLLTDTAGVATASVLMDIADGIEDGPPAASLGCLRVAQMVFVIESFGHGVAACDILAAGIAADSGEPLRAVGLYKQGLAGLDASFEPALTGRGWHNFGILLRRLGRAEESYDAQRLALAAYRDCGLATPVADCHVGIGMALHDLGRLDEALEPYAAARALYREFGEEHLLADVDDRRGLVLCDLGRYEEAEAAHSAAITRYDSLDEEHRAARSRRYRSHPLDHAGRGEDAIADLDAARATFADLGDDLEVARCDAALAAALIGLGQERAARPLLDSARRALEALDEQHEAAWCAELLADPTTITHRHPES